MHGLNPDSVVVKGGAVIIVAGTLILVFSAINFVLLFLKDKSKIRPLHLILDGGVFY